MLIKTYTKLFWALSLLSTSASGAPVLTWAGEMPLPFSWKAMRIPKWSHGAIVEVQNATNAANPLVWVVDRQHTSTVPFSIPGATEINVYDWDRSFDGQEVVLSGSAMDNAGKGGYFAARLSIDGVNATVTQDPLYMPRHIAFAPDGTVWTAGAEWKGTPNSEVFRHYDKNGKVLGAFVPKSAFPDPLILIDHTGRLMVSNDRVAWYSPRGGRYIELTLDGAVLNDLSVTPPNDVAGGYNLVLAGSGDVYLSAVQFGELAGGVTWRINILDRAARTWRSVFEQSTTRENPRSFGHLYGVENIGGNEQLVIAGDRRAMFYSISK